MLPFARMLEYGNTAPTGAHIIKVEGSKVNQQYTVFLTNTGNLWAIGANNSGMFGTGNTTALTVWTKIATNVKNFWSDAVASPGGVLLYITNDNNWFSAGLATCLGVNASGTQIFTNRTSQFSAITYDNIRYLQLTYENICIVMNNNTVYTGGLNGEGRLGTNNTNFGNFTLRTDIGTTVQKARFSRGNATFYVLKTDGSLTGSGLSGNGQLNGNATRTTFITLNTAVLDFWPGVNNYFVRKSDGIYVAGSNVSGQNGNGTTSGTVTVPTLVSAIGSPEYFYPNYNNNMTFNVGTGVINVWGDNGNGKLGTGNNTSLSVPTAHDKVQLPTFERAESLLNYGWFTNTSNSYILGADYMIYVSGTSGTHTPGIGSTTNRFLPLILPTNM